VRYKVVFEYDGTDFEGWQLQPGKRTIQGEVEAALERLFGGPIRVHPSGRTDTGVHALGQVAVFDAVERDVSGVRRGLDAHLPQDVAAVSVEACADDFDPRRSARSKHYRYRWLVREGRSPLRRTQVRHLRAPLDVAAMDQAVAALVGTHDFASFRAVGCASTHAVRTVRAARVTGHGDEVHLDVFGHGFLRHMVRIVAGTIERIGQGRRPPEWLAAVRDARDRSAAGPTAPACGLTLVEVRYDGPPAYDADD
jgi:tRNA pseudouridine38-40 synthase